MKITPVKIKVRDLVKGYVDDLDTNQVTGYDGKLIIRPSFQRQFGDRQRDEVVNTIKKDSRCPSSTG